MKKNIFTRLKYHFHEKPAETLVDFTDDDDDEDLAAFEEQTRRDRQRHLEEAPVIRPQRTVVIFSLSSESRCNFLTAWAYRVYLRRAYHQLRGQGVNTFITDYSTPLGLLAHEVLIELRRSGEIFHLYTFRHSYLSERRTYRLIRETPLEIIRLTLEADYRYYLAYQLSDVRSFQATAGTLLTERGILRRT